MTIILIPPADQELIEAIGYYNDQLVGLGDQFYTSFLNTINYITKAPEAWKKIGSNTRRINLKATMTTSYQKGFPEPKS